MKLDVINFKCHTKGSWEFPNKGLCLLTGTRGKGKSSILEAIIYALYGPSAISKPCTFGENKSIVKLDIDSLNITRTSRPRKLVVYDKSIKFTYEGNEAQSVIENWLDMNYSQFRHSCYIPQKSNGSILSLTPMEQLNCIEELALKGGKHRIIQDNIKSSIKTTELKIVQTQNSGEIFKKLFEEFNAQLGEFRIIECPITNCNNYTSEILEGLKKEKRNSEERLLNFESEYKKNHEYLRTSRELDKGRQMIITRKQSILAVIARLEGEISSIQIDSDNMEIVYKNERDVAQLEEDIKICEVYKIIEEKERELKVILLERKKEIKTEFDKLKRDIEAHLSLIDEDENEVRKILESSTTNKPEYTKKEAMSEIKTLIIKARKELELPTTVKNINKIIEYLKNYEVQISGDIKEANETINKFNLELGKLSITSQTYICPNCEIELAVEGEILVRSQSKEEKGTAVNDIKSKIVDIHSDIENLQLSGDKCREIIDKIIFFSKFATVKGSEDEKIYRTIEELQNYRGWLEKLTSLKAQKSKYIEEAKNLTKQATPVRLQEEIDRLKKSINSTDRSMNISDLDSLKKKLEVLSNKLTEYYHKRTRIGGLEKELRENKNALSTIDRKIKTYDNLPDLEELEENVENLRLNIDSIKDKIINLSELISKCIEYGKYLELKTKMSQAKESLEGENKVLKALEDKHKNLLKLKELSFQAEHVAIQKVIEDINEHSSYWLNLMFIKDPISVNLESVKEIKGGKNSKLQMNVKVTYKSHIYDSIDSLSGGERDQVNLAFVLGVNTMLNGKMLILDESLASLDAETNNETLTLLKEIVNNKPILVVSHEIISGIFDNQIDV